MGKRKVTDEQIGEILGLYRELRSYRAVGRTLTLDPRTVKDKVLRAEGVEQRQYWQTVSREVDRKLLQDHYDQLVQVVLILQDVVHSSPLVAQPKWRARKYLPAQMEARFVSRESLSSGGPGLSDRGRQQRLAALLTEDIMGHEPSLPTALDRWKGVWDRIQRARRALVEPAKNYLQAREVDSGLAKGVAPHLVQDVMKMLFPGKQRGALTGSTLMRGGRSIFGLTSLQVQTVAEAYEWTLDQMIKAARAQGVGELSEELERSVKRIDDLIDRLTLRGRPEGRCIVFPLVGIAPP